MGIAIAQERHLDEVRLENESAQYLLDCIMCNQRAAATLECWLRGEEDDEGREVPSCLSVFVDGCSWYLDGELPILTEDELTRCLLGTEYDGRDVYPGNGNKRLFEALEIPYPSEEDIKARRLPTGYRRTSMVSAGSGVFPIQKDFLVGLLHGIEKNPEDASRIVVEYVRNVEQSAEEAK